MPVLCTYQAAAAGSPSFPFFKCPKLMFLHKHALLIVLLKDSVGQYHLTQDSFSGQIKAKYCSNAVAGSIDFKRTTKSTELNYSLCHNIDWWGWQTLFRNLKVSRQQWQLRHLIHPVTFSKGMSGVISLNLSWKRAPWKARSGKKKLLYSYTMRIFGLFFCLKERSKEILLYLRTYNLIRCKVIPRK